MIFLRSLGITSHAPRASLSENSDAGSYCILVHPECSCWKHFLWIVMPLRGASSRSVHPYLLEFTEVAFEVRRDSLAFSTSQERVCWKKYQHFKKFSIWDVYLCRRVYMCVSSFPQMLFPILILNIFLPQSFPDLSSPSYVCLTFYFSGCEPLSLIWKESKNSVWFPIRCRVNALKFSLDCVCFPHIPYG